MSENFAVIRLNSKQFIIKKGETLQVDRVSPDATLQVLLAEMDGNVLVGSPLVEKFGVKLEVTSDLKDEKIEVRRYKSKSRYRKHKGHRQPISIISVVDFGEKVKNELVWKKETEAVEASIETVEKPSKVRKVAKKDETKET